VTSECDRRDKEVPNATNRSKIEANNAIDELQGIIISSAASQLLKADPPKVQSLADALITLGQCLKDGLIAEDRRLLDLGILPGPDWTYNDEVMNFKEH
jgi:hypothetical protein